MRVLIIQEKGRHEKNWMFRESLSIQRALDTIGVESTVWGLGYENYEIPFSKLETDHDVIFLIENYPLNNWVPDLSKSNKLKVFWSIDSHVVLNAHINMCDRYKIDLVLNSVYGHDNFFKNQKSYYFPNAYPDELIYPLTTEKIYDVGFCGNINNRGSWIEQIKTKHNIKVDEFVIGHDMVESINKYKIHFNRNLSDDVNYRTFETLGCKTFLITNETPGLNKLFNIDEHLVTYNSSVDLFEKINYYLSNPIKRDEISENGYKHVIENHTFKQRVVYLMKIINENI